MARRKDGLWQERVRQSNGKYKYFYGHSKAETLRKIAVWKAEQPIPSASKLFEDVADEWFEQKKLTIEANTMYGYRAPLARFKEAFKGRQIRDIRPIDVSNVMDRLISENNMALKTARNHLSVLTLIFRFAVLSDYIETNPAREITVDGSLPRTKRTGASSADIAIVKQNYALPFGDFAYWILYTGLRRSELMALRWEDIDIDRRTITVRRSVYKDEFGHMQLKTPKSAAGVRVVPLLDSLANRIMPGDGLVFPSVRGDFLTYGELQTAWERYVKQTGLSCTIHQLRHSYTTMLFEAELDIKTISSYVGHAQTSTTFDVYTDLRAQREEEKRKTILSIDID